MLDAGRDDDGVEAIASKEFCSDDVDLFLATVADAGVLDFKEDAVTAGRLGLGPIRPRCSITVDSRANYIIGCTSSHGSILS